MNTFMCDLLMDMDYIAMNHVHLIDRMLPPNMRGDERGEYDLYTLFSNYDEFEEEIYHQLCIIFLPF